MSLPPRVTDSLSDWETTKHIEKGQLFGVAYRKGSTCSASIEDSGPHESLQRDGRYLLPYNLQDGRFVTTYTQTSAMLERQRKCFHFRDGDLVVASFPRSGTTWFEQTIMLLLSRGDPDALNTTTKNAYDPSEPHSRGKLCLELLFHDKAKESDVGYPWGNHSGQAVVVTPEQVDHMPSPRMFKTHLHPFIIPGFGHYSSAKMDRLPDVEGYGKDVRMVYVIRDPKDVVLSLYRVHLCDMTRHGMPFTAYAKLFLQGENLCGGPWADIVKNYIKLAKLYPRQFKVMTYEENSNDPINAMRDLAEFFGLGQLTEEELERCRRHSSFDAMKSATKGARIQHVHQGKVGTWRDVMSKEMVAAFNDLVSDPELGDYGKRYIVALDTL